MILFIQQEYMLIREGDTNGQGFIFSKFTVDNIVRAVAGDLCGTVQVDVGTIRQCALQFVQVLDGHGFP